MVLHALDKYSDGLHGSVLQSNIMRRVDVALFMVAALENEDLVHEAPAIVSCQAPSALRSGG